MKAGPMKFEFAMECAARCALFTPWNAQPLNTSALARQAKVSRPTMTACLDVLEREGLIRLIPFYGGHRRPILYLPSWFPGLWLEAIIARLVEINPGCQFFWWKTGRVRQIDLLAIVGKEKVGFCVSSHTLQRRKQWLPLRTAFQSYVIDRGFLLYPRGHPFSASHAVRAMPIHVFMQDVEYWILGDALTLMRPGDKGASSGLTARVRPRFSR